MDEFGQIPQFFEEGIKLINECPLCGLNLLPTKAQLVDESQDYNLVHLTCNKCQGNLLAIIMSTEIGVSSVVLVSDLSYDDILEFKNKSQITADQVLEIHQGLKKKNLVKKILAYNNK